MSPRIKRFPFLAALILGALITRLILDGLSGVGVAALIIALVWFAIEFTRWLLPIRSKQQTPEPTDSDPLAEPGEELISLVFFLTEPREADESSIRNCISNALGIRFNVNDPDSEFFVIPFSPPAKSGSRDQGIRHFMVKIPEGLFSVLISNRPYIENPKSFARGAIRDKRLRSAVERHQAWISVDLMDDTIDPGETSAAYGVIGKMLASMGGPDCLAVYCPALQRCNEFDTGLLETLSIGDPLRLFNEPTFEPVIEISDSNPKMAAAVKEAVSRWSEFAAAYEEAPLSLRERFIAKAEFREGKKSEFMWVTVMEITPDRVSGILMNDPHELLELHRGANVTFRLSRLNDWIYPDPGGGHVGGFTLDVLADADEE